MDALGVGAVLAAAVGSGLMAGIFFTFSVVVMPALRRRPPAEAMAAMQTMNEVIVNPLFVVVFVGTGLVSATAIVLALVGPGRSGALAAAAGGVLYLVALVVTGTANVPRNDALDAADPASATDSALWTRYLREWTAWNHVRTVSTTAALTLFVLAALAPLP